MHLVKNVNAKNERKFWMSTPRKPYILYETPQTEGDGRGPFLVLNFISKNISYFLDKYDQKKIRTWIY